MNVRFLSLDNSMVVGIDDEGNDFGGSRFGEAWRELAPSGIAWRRRLSG
jgi:hypothetical protein